MKMMNWPLAENCKCCDDVVQHVLNVWMVNVLFFTPAFAHVVHAGCSPLKNYTYLSEVKSFSEKHERKV